VTELTQESWLNLFAQTPGEPGVTVSLRVVRRGGRPFLFLPSSPRLGSTALELYPAQSAKARFAKATLWLALKLGIQPGLDKLSLTVLRGDAFAAFLARTANLSVDLLPRFAVLAGNPKAPGRRDVFLLFDAHGQPAAVVKAGHREPSRRLIAREVTLLKSLPSRATAVPRVRGSFVAANVEAFSMDFIAGASPTTESPAELAKIFLSWLEPAGELSLGELPAWQRLFSSIAEGLLPQEVRALGSLRVRPTLMHGDFAPWNVKVSHGHWTVLDWERGELAGVPGWDWFHFVMQPALLVRRETPEKLLAHFEGLLNLPEFQDYAGSARIVEQTRALAYAYLVYCLHITRQTEGREGLQALAGLAAVRWFSKPR